MKHIAVITLVFILAGCATKPPGVNASLTLTAACQTAASIVRDLAQYRKQKALSPNEIIAVTGVVAAIDPFCNKVVPVVDIPAALTILESQLVYLSAVQRAKERAARGN